jgi:hypothetical protein
MISKYFCSRVLALAAIGATLVGCDSIKDVRSTPSTPLPDDTVVLQGTVSGLSSKRPVVLINNGQLTGSIGVAAPPPAESNESLNGVTPFTFGTLPVGTPYNITVYQNPIGKSCSVKSGGTGTLTKGVQTNVVIECINVGTRYSMTVTLAKSFSDSENAQVVLTTEERIYRINPAGALSVTFTDVLFNPTPSPQGFNWNVVASNTVGGTLNKCPVTHATNVSGATITNPTANVTDVSVAACQFTIGGTVSYSPVVSGGAAPATPPQGLVVELRDLGENTVQTQAYSGTWGGTFNFTDANGPIQFVSNRKAIYSVAVKTHPAGMYCLVVNPMAILYAPTLTSNPTNITSPVVQCRETPTLAANQLRGVYRHSTTTFKRTPTSDPVTSTYNALDFSKQNTASSNMIALFPNGTFIYGTHANTVQIERGFYNYDSAAKTLKFTLNADTNTSIAFPSNFSPANANSPAAVATTTPGMSALPGATRPGNGRTAVDVTMTNVSIVGGEVTGTFSGCQYYSLPTSPTAPLPACNSGDSSVASNASIDWTLTAPPSREHEMTGAWLAQDSRRLWVFDKETYYGTHVGVVGVYAMNDACFTMPDVSVSSGIYTRRPSINGCYPWPRPATGQQPPYSLSGFVESVDTKVPQFIGSGAGQVDIGTLPDYMSRIPGGAQAVDGRSPSPIRFHIAAPADFFATAPAEYFPEPAASEPSPLEGCTTEILGIRTTLNAVPIHKPIYFCRFVP